MAEIYIQALANNKQHINDVNALKGVLAPRFNKQQQNAFTFATNKNITLKYDNQKWVTPERWQCSHDSKGAKRSDLQNEGPTA